MTTQSIDFNTCSASDAAQALITLELGRGIAYAASVRRGENHVREMLQGINAAVSTSLLKADEIKVLVGDVMNGFKQQCHRMNLAFTVGSKKSVLYTSPREVKQATPAATDTAATPATDTAATPATDTAATETTAELRAVIASLRADLQAVTQERDNALAELATVRTQLEALLASTPVVVQTAPAKKIKRPA